MNENLELKTKCLGNFKMSLGHTSNDIAKVIREVVKKRCGNVVPSYIVTDSAAVNKRAVRLFLNDFGDDH